MSSPELQPPGPRHPDDEDGASLIAGGEPPGCEPWSHLRLGIEPQFLSKAVRSGTFPFYEVSYAPSFYRGCRIAVIEWPEAAQISLMMFVGELTARGREQLLKEGWPQHGPPPPDLKRWDETGRPDQHQIDRFHESLPVSIPLRPENSAGAGCDGMTVHCWFRWGNRMGPTESWQDQEPATFQLARAVHRLATEVLREPTSLEALREIEMFLRP
jgi:hypothetical protein